jgi:UDP-N-acetylglucosamine 2-epimerase (non-hydrolysing)
MRIAIVIGTRPEAIKIWPLISEISEAGHKSVLISTGQQHEILSETLLDLKLMPDFDLDIMKKHLSLVDFLNAALVEIRDVLEEVKPEIVIVQGDTSSALAGALAAHLQGIPVGHVEAGLRSGDMKSPWPEEGNRRLIDSIAALLWVPTDFDLIKGAKDQRVEITGNTVVDSLRLVLQNKPYSSDASNLILVTLHRRESFGKQMIAALNEIIILSEKITNEIVFIQHPNTKVEEAILKSGLDKSRVKIIKPLKYSEFIYLLSKSKLLITDSGGLQEEAYSLGIPLIVVRDKTERIEALGGNTDLLVGGDGKHLIDQALYLLKNENRNELNLSKNKLGDGYAAKRILKSLENWQKSAHK